MEPHPYHEGIEINDSVNDKIRYYNKNLKTETWQDESQLPGCLEQHLALRQSFILYSQIGYILRNKGYSNVEPEARSSDNIGTFYIPFMGKNLRI